MCDKMKKGREGYVSRISPITGVRWSWYGGHGIHGHVGRREIAFFNVGPYDKDSLTKDEAQAAVERVAYKTSEEQSQYAMDEHEMRLIATGKYKKPHLREVYV